MEIAVNYLKVLILLGIGCFVGFLFVFGVDLQLSNSAKVETTVVNMNTTQAKLKQDTDVYQRPIQVSNGTSSNDKSHENTDFYRLIVDNNIFRPLGWTPPNKEPVYRLIGTFIGTNGTYSEAFIEENRSNQFYIVSVGDKIGDAVIKEIDEELVTIDNNGEIITLNDVNMVFLGSSNQSQNASTSRYDRNNETERSHPRGTYSKSTDTEAQKKRIAKIMKESNKQIKNVMKEVSKIEKGINKTEYKMLIEKKKSFSSDFKQNK